MSCQVALATYVSRLSLEPWSEITPSAQYDIRHVLYTGSQHGAYH